VDEAHAIAQVRNGSKDAFTCIVEHYEAPVVRYLYRITGDYETARDLAQDTFIQAYKGLLKTSSEVSFKAWLYKIATNNALQVLRRKRILSLIIFAEPTKIDPLVTKDNSRDVEDNIEIEEALLKIPRKQRVCMVLHFIEGFKYREIAKILKISEDAVRMRVARGSQEFRRLYRNEEVKSDEMLRHK
jgi:RNA polymerase sigma-70 factor (ECF subfamily)